MTDLETWLAQHRVGRGTGKVRRMDPSRPATTWREEESLRGEVVDTLVAVLQTRGCSHDRDHGGCTMCGYSSETPREPPGEEDLLSQVEHVRARRGKARWVKLYTSGSMLDPDEVPPRVMGAIVAAFDDVDMLTVESRAEHVTAERVASLGDPSRTEVAIGLESACDRVLQRSVHKGMAREEFEQAARHVRGAGASLRTYVLLKPPFLTEAEAMADAAEAMRWAADVGATTVSLNPVHVERDTLVDHMFHRGEWEPPWLWSVTRVLGEVTAQVPSTTRVMSSPTAGGKARGAHNCGECDEGVLRAIEFYRLSGDPRDLEAAPNCPCQARWRAQLDLEGFQQGPFAPQRYRRDR